ncbi:MAG: hypothetical protein BWK80_18415, partial [Desulfobacteraceae bacterium IS3]
GQGLDSITFTLNLCNTASGTNAASAFDWVFTDPLPSEYQNPQTPTFNVGATGATVSAAFSGNTLTGTVDQLDPGECVTVTYKADLRADVAFGMKIPNTAQFTTGSLPGNKGTNDSTPGNPGTDTGERNGAGGVNDLNGSEGAEVSIATPTIAKETVDPQAWYAVGEKITYRLTAGAPLGSTESFVIKDQLSSGVSFVSGSLKVTLPAGSSYTHASDPVESSPFFTNDTANSRLIFDFGTIRVAATGNVTVEYQTEVKNIMANQDGTPLPNTATLSYSDPDNPGSPVTLPPVTNPHPVRVGEPDLEIIKELSSGSVGADAGDKVSWRIVIQNTGHVSACQVRWKDILPDGMEQIGNVGVTPSAGNVYLNGTATSVSESDVILSDTVNSKDTISLPPLEITSGASLILTFDCILSDSVTPGQTLDNIIRVPYTSIPDGGRDSSTSPNVNDDENDNPVSGTDLNNYQEIASESLTAGAYAAIDKTLEGTKTEFTVGETLTYAIRIAFMEGRIPAVRFHDSLPSGLTYVAHQIVVGNMGIRIGNPAYNTVQQSGQALDFDLGEVSNPANGNTEDDYIVIKITARVANMLANQDRRILNNGMEAEGNPVWMEYGVVPKRVPFDSDAATPGNQGIPITVAEPDLSLSKTSDRSQQSLGDIVTFTVIAAHTGTSHSDAYDVVIQDTLPEGLTYLDCSLPDADMTSEGQNLEFSKTLITSGEPDNGQWRFTYRARVDSTTVAGQPLANEMRLTWKSLPDALGLDDSGRTGGDGTGGLNDYAKDAVATVTPTTSTVIDAVKTVKLADDADADAAVTSGDTLEYLIALHNTDGNVSDVIFSDKVPNFTSYIPGSLTADKGETSDSDGKKLSVIIGDMAPDETVTIKFQVKVNPSLPDGTVISNQGSVDSGQTVPEPTDSDANDANGDQPTEVTVGNVGAGPGLIAEKTFVLSKDEIEPVDGTINVGDTIIYTIRITNVGNVELTNLNLRDMIPDQITVTDVLRADLIGTHEVKATYNKLAPGASITAQVTGIVNAAGAIVNQGSVRSDETDLRDTDADPNSAGDQPTAFTAEEEGIAGKPLLEVLKSDRLFIDADTDGTVSPGDTLRYTVTVTNSGSAAASDVNFKDTVPEHTVIVPGSVQASRGLVLGEEPIEINVGQIKPGEMITVFFQVLIDTPLNVGTELFNQAEVTAKELTCEDPVSGDPLSGEDCPVKSDDPATPPPPDPEPQTSDPTSTPVISAPELTLVKTGEPNPVTISETVTYTLKYENNGNADAHNVVVTDPIPANTTFVEAIFVTEDSEPAPGEVAVSDGKVIWNLGDVKVGDTGELQVTVRTVSGLNNGAILTNKEYSIDSDETEPEEGEPVTTRVYVPPATVGDRVWIDTNGNGVQDTGEPGMAGIIVYIDVSGDGIREPGEPYTVTDAAGNYQFTELPPRTYRIGSDNSSVPNTYAPTTVELVTVTLSPGQNYPDADFGYTRQNTASIGDTVFYDDNGNKVQDPGEQGIPNVTVYIDSNNNGRRDPGEPLVVTDATGKYLFSDLMPGEYKVQTDNATVPTGYAPTRGTDPISVSLTKGQSFRDADFGWQRRSVFITDVVKSVTDINGGNLRPGDELLYTIVIRNPDDMDVSNAVFEDTLPDYTSYSRESVSAPTGSVVESESPILRITGITLPARGQVSISFQVWVDKTLPAGIKEIVNQGILKYDSNSDRIPDSEQPTDGDTSLGGSQPTAIPVTAGPNFTESSKSVTLKVDADFNTAPTSGDTLLYTLMIRNTGDRDAVGVKVTDPIPEQVTYVSDSAEAASGTVTFEENRIVWIGDIAAKESVRISFEVTLKPALPVGLIISNQGVVEFDSDDDGTRDASVPTDGDGAEPGTQPTETEVGGIADEAYKSVSDVNGGNLEPGDEMLYTIVLINRSIHESDGTDAVDSIPAHTSYVPGSLSAPPGSTVVSPVTGGDQSVIRITNITVPAMGQTEFTFRVKVDKPLPAGVRQITNQALMGYYPVRPGEPEREWQSDGDTGEPGEQPTVIPVTAGPNLGETVKDVVLFKDADDSGTFSPGDTLRYTVTIPNTGNQEVKNVFFTDNIPVSTEYVAGSVTASQGTVSFSSEKKRVEWTGDIAAGDRITLTFDVTIAQGLVPGKTISNQGTVVYDLNGDGEPEGSVPTDSDISRPGDQPTDVVPGGVRLSSVKSVTDKNGGNTEPGDRLIYTVVLKNGTGFDVEGIEFVDVMPSQTQYVADSLSAPPGSTVKSESPTLRITDIGIPAYSQVTISFSVTVNSPLAAGIRSISNQGIVNYDGNGDGVNEQRTESDGDVTSPGNQPTILPVTAGPNFSEAVKSVRVKSDKDQDRAASSGDILEYRIVIPNSGNQDAQAVSFSDRIPAHTEYVPDSAAAGSGLISYNVSENRIKWLGDIAAGSSETITFDVMIVENTAPQTLISNQGELSFDSNADGTDDSSELTDGNTTLPGNQPAEITTEGLQCMAFKTAEDMNGGNLEPGDEVLYSVIIPNRGLVSDDRTEFSDTIPTMVTLVPGSLTTPPGSTVLSETPVLRITNITVPGYGEARITFRVLVINPLPAGISQIDNQAVLKCYYCSTGTDDRSLTTDSDTAAPGNQPAILPVTAGPYFGECTKTVSLKTDADDNGFLSPGDTLGYSGVISNTGNQHAQGAIFYDEIPANTRFVPGTLFVEKGTAIYNSARNRIEWTGDIAAGEEIPYSFDVTVNAGTPMGTVISNQGTLIYDEDKDGKTDLTETTDADTDPDMPGNQPADMTLGKAPHSVRILKSVTDINSGQTLAGDELLYTVTMENLGKAPAEGLEFYDAIPDHTLYVPGSLSVPPGSKIAGETPAVVVTNITIPGSQSVKLMFRVRVVRPIPQEVTEVSNQGWLLYASTGNGIPDATQRTDSDPNQEGTQPTVTPLTNTGKAELGDYVWFDIDRDGIQEAGEPGIAGVTVKLVNQSSAAVSTATTDGNGFYIFRELDPGDYTVRFVKPDGYEFSPRNRGTEDSQDSDADTENGRTETVTLYRGDSLMTVDAGLFLPDSGPAGLGNFVWYDTDHNGVQDAGEPGIPGVTVRLRDADNKVIAETLTDGSGFYQFTGLIPGDYSVKFVLPPEYVFTTANYADDSDENDSDADKRTGLSQVVTLIEDEFDPTIDAGMFIPGASTASLGDTVWLDENHDGVQNPDEKGVAGLKVNLLDPNTGSVLARTQTNAAGFYLFTGLVPGNYAVEFEAPEGYAFSPQNQGDDKAADSDADTDTGRTDMITLSAGENNITIDAGIFIPADAIASLGDYVWYDTDRNGIQDSEESGVAGVTVNLLDPAAGNKVISTTTTDGSGYYRFSDLKPGTYSVEFVKPADYTFTTADSTSDSTDSDANTETGRTAQVILTAGEHNPTIDAGLFLPNAEPASLGDYVWYDTDRNGIQNAGESGVAGVKVSLLDASGERVISETVTEGSGFYGFAGLAPGTYRLKFAPPPGGYELSPANRGTNDVKDSDANKTTGLSDSITLASGEHNPTIDAGLYIPNTLPASLGDLVWYDKDRDGLQDADEPGIAGVSVYLYKEGLSPTSPYSKAVTDADGLYDFRGLAPGNYTVKFDLPDGYSFTPSNKGENDEADSDADTTTGYTGQLALAAGEDNISIDAGLYASALASLGDYVWYDVNHDGIQDSNESGVTGVKVRLLDVDSNVTATTATDGSGYYRFSNLLPGTYSVEFVKPSGYSFTTDDSADAADSEDSDADTVTGRTAQVKLSAGEHNPTLDAGIFIPNTLPSSLGDYVWYDSDQDGIQDSGEPGIAGVTVNLLDSAGKIIAQTKTDGSGSYEFAGLAPGTYSVKFIAPAEYQITSANRGTNDSADSDANKTTGKTAAVTLAPGEHNPTLDAGMFIPGTMPASIGDKVWYDLNQNGLQDDSEPGVSGLTVNLYDDTGTTLLSTAISDAEGFYEFTGLAAGNYIVKFDPAPGYKFTTANDSDNANDSSDSDADPTTGYTETIILAAGEHNPMIDAGLIGSMPSSLGDYVWYDVNRDGIQNSNESGVAGVKVNLLDPLSGK